jgi:hypothetical protein
MINIIRHSGYCLTEYSFCLSVQSPRIPVGLCIVAQTNDIGNLFIYTSCNIVISYESHTSSNIYTLKNNVRWVPCHPGMERPQVAGGGDGLQIWRVEANVLNKQSWIAQKGWFPS